MKLLDRFILIEVAPMFAGAVMVFTAVVLIITSTNLIGLLAQRVPVFIVVELITLNVIPWLVATFPMAMLIASILAFVRLSTDSEAAALLASGISFRRMLIPVMVFSVLVTLLSLVSNDTISPYAERRYDSLKASVGKDLFQHTGAFDLPAQHDQLHRLTFTIHVDGGYTDSDQSLHDVTINEYDPATGEVAALYHAQSAKWQSGLTWTLYNATVVTINAQQNIAMVGKTPALAVMDMGQTPQSVNIIANDPDSFDFRELYRQIQEMERSHTGDAKTIRLAEVTLWFKIALPCASLIFGLVGAPLGLRPQRAASRQSAIALGLVIILCYYALFEYMKVLGSSGSVNPILAAFTPNMVGLAAGIYLIRRAAS